MYLFPKSIHVSFINQKQLNLIAYRTPIINRYSYKNKEKKKKKKKIEPTLGLGKNND